MEFWQFVLLAVLLVLLIILGIIIIVKLGRIKPKNQDDSRILDAIAQQRKESLSSNSALRQEILNTTQNSLANFSHVMSQNQHNFEKSQAEKMREINTSLTAFSAENEVKLENIRLTMERRLSAIQEENNKKLEDMRSMVDEKLQKTLEEKLTRSFAMVSERLEQVYKGLGEMQNLAVGVGDLKKVLSNVKTRGTLGEIQLGAILREILSPEQYEENVATKKGSRAVVEFAVKLPNDNDSFIYLPIDSKFPGDTYSALQAAYENGEPAQIESAAKILITTIRNEAKDIRDKYIDPPNTTEFALMFLPFEGLYSEVVNRGMVEVLQREYKVNIAGPSTMAALLNSLQMGFKTLVVQKRSAEVWKVLSEVKKEFDNFEKVLDNTRVRLNQANDELEKLVGVRTRQIQRKLNSVQSLELQNGNDE